jgi:hypothetical protein
MKPSRKVYEAISFVAILLFCGLSAAQEPKAKDWGNTAHGLQMRIYLDQAATGQSKVPRFKVELRNVGERDLLLNFGIMARNGEQQYATAVSLILVDPQGEPHWLELKRTLLGSDARKEPLFLPLPVGGTFSFPVDLENYWAGTSNEINYKLKPGTYRLAAHLSGFIETANPVTFRTFRTEGPGFQPIARRSFDTVNPDFSLGPSPMSNTLQFEVPVR